MFSPAFRHADTASRHYCHAPCHTLITPLLTPAAIHATLRYYATPRHYAGAMIDAARYYAAFRHDIHDAFAFDMLPPFFHYFRCYATPCYA